MDKRAAARVPVRVPALCRSNGVVIGGMVEDLSRGGLFFTTPELVSAGSSAEIELELPGEPPLHLTGEVVRVERDPERRGLGLRIHVDGAGRRPLANFIMRQHATRR
jgi:PilZ domain